jgi:hypothetical protein
MVEIVISTKRGTSDEKSKISIINFELKINNSQLGFNNTHLVLRTFKKEFVISTERGTSDEKSKIINHYSEIRYPKNHTFASYKLFLLTQILV